MDLTEWIDTVSKSLPLPSTLTAILSDEEKNEALRCIHAASRIFYVSLLDHLLGIPRRLRISPKLTAPEAPKPPVDHLIRRRGGYTPLSLCSSRFWAATAPSFKGTLRLNLSQSKVAESAAGSRTTTTTVCELAKFRRNHILTKKALRSICSHLCRMYTGAAQTSDFEH
jgi:hypothetical protein